MGNRAVITTEENFKNNGVGVYLHWNGGRDSVEGFLKYCELKGYRAPDSDCYGWARLVQVVSNFFGGSLSVGISTIDHLDCDNFDNGVYLIKGWEIVGREYFKGTEQDEYPLDEMLQAIDERMPEREQLGDYLTAEEVDVSELKIGDTVYIRDWYENIKEVTILDFGDDRVVNGTNVKGLPYAEICGGTLGKDNINNYITYKKIRRK
jgi:hypothetical protein